MILTGLQRRADFNRSSNETLALKVVDQDGKELPRFHPGGNQLEYAWKPLLLPRNAFLSFQIGSSMRQGLGDYLGEYLEFHFWTQWKISPTSATTLYLTGTFTVAPTPRQYPNPDWIWSGTLNLPKVEIPKVP